MNAQKLLVVVVALSLLTLVVSGTVAAGSGSVDVTDHGDAHDTCNEGHSNPTDSYSYPVDGTDDCGVNNGDATAG